MAVDYTDEYLAFYSAYPRKEGKADGFKAWRNLSQTDQRTALADVEKRKRMNAFSANKKLVQLPASYIRARRWEDDWQDTLESSRKGDDQFVGLGAVIPKPKVEEVQLHWKERLINRCFFAYRIEAGQQLPEVATALQIKKTLLDECQVLTEEPAEQAAIMAPLFMDRMDAAYGLNAGARALRRARTLRQQG